jgi:pimeloyl-ACP methyl ester carboxylesterase
MTTTPLHFIDNGQGHRLALRRVAPHSGAPIGAHARARPLLIVPGYGMNSFIFSFHPHGLSLEAYLASRGIEVFSVDLRIQGASERTAAAGLADRYGLSDLADTDVGVAIDAVRELLGGDGLVDVLGASLGASLVLGHLAMHPDAPVGSVVSLGGLVTWVRVPWVVRALFGSPGVIGRVPFRGTRKLAGFALPALARVAPGLLSIYLHTQSTDIADAKKMVETVEDPNRHVNREIAEWVRRRELVLGGVNVSQALPSIRNPLLCVVAMQDGIVPPETGRAIYDAIGSARKELLCVGTASSPIAHADLFLSTGAQDAIFAKIADFLLEDVPRESEAPDARGRPLP